MQTDRQTGGEGNSLAAFFRGSVVTKTPIIASAMLHTTGFLFLWFFIPFNIPSNKPAVKLLPAMFIDLTSAPVTGKRTAEHEQAITRQEMPLAKYSNSGPIHAACEQRQVEGEPSMNNTDQPVNSGQVSDISQAFANASRIQAMVMRARRYFEFTEMALKKMLEGKLAFEERQKLEGCTATVTATYGAEEVVDLSVAAENQELRRLLRDNVDWKTISSPGKYMLNYNKVIFNVSMERARVVIGISPQ